MTEKIAHVVVDVPASNIDRFFDYMIPEHLKGAIEVGMRVIVPFGHRTIMGYVLSTSNETDIDPSKLKEIKSILDVQPVLTRELIELGKWLAQSTMSFYISSFQAMLPQALKASYDKSLHRLKPPENQQLNQLFDGRDVISFEELTEHIPLNIVNEEIKKENVEWEYHVLTKESYKRVMMVEVVGSVNSFDLYLAELTKQAKKQYQLVQYFLDMKEKRTLKQVLKDNKTTRHTLGKLIDQHLIKLTKEQVNREPYQGNMAPSVPLTLEPQQQKAFDKIVEKLESAETETFLLHGVTGSGKTEVYLQAIDRTLMLGKEAIVLVPEISLTPMMVERFKRRFGDQVAVLHSALSTGERFDEWRKIQKKQVKVAVGARSAIFAPFENLGMIIIDEEHESTYKQEDHPRYHVRDVAKKRAAYHGCPVVLGTATPTLETFARAQKGVYQFIDMPERINQSVMPKVTIQDMREELHQGNRTMFSQKLRQAIDNRLENKEQVVLFLNRRGYSTFVMCRDCGHTVGCPSCDISLTYHQRDHRLKCHYCNYSEPMPKACPSCQSESIRFFGTGTEKVEEALNQTFPEARIIRMDVDTTRKKGAHERLLKQFGNKQADILLGTQMIAKGLDFPDVTLVGVLAADGLLNLPDFRAAEKTFQLLTQVSGRAGRHELTGEVIVQTYTPEHYSVLFAKDYDYLGFFKQEMALRKAYQYPPYYYLTLVTISHENRFKAEEVTRVIQKLLVKHLSERAIVLGPTPSPIERIKGRYRFQCMVKYKDEPNLIPVLRKILDHYDKECRNNQLMIQIDLNPQQLM